MLAVSDFNYDLPKELIAQTPAEPRDTSRLMVLARQSGQITHQTFRQLGEWLRPGDILVANNSRVIPARLYGHKAESGGRVELLLLEERDAHTWRVLAGGRRLRPGTTIVLHHQDGSPSPYQATIKAELDGPQREIQFDRPVRDVLPLLGHTPLPPYIHTPLDDPERYQTIYARPDGSAAAPTAGLHFTPELLFSLREMGVLFETCTLHVGLDTFKPVEVERVAEHVIHSEWAELTPEAARRINEAVLAGGRVIAVGTTSTRVLETAALRSAGIQGSLQQISARDAIAKETGEDWNACPWKPVIAFSGPTDLFVYPGYRYRVVNGLITNFHLPQSSLLMMVSAFTGREALLEAYRVAIAERYRFYSFGDAMLII